MRARIDRRGFTLIELLIVVAIIGVLATLLLTAIFSAKGKAQRGVAKSQIRAIQAALQMYEGDHGKFPRHTARPSGTNATITGSSECWNDDAPALYMALRNKPTRELGGGQNSPYLEWNVDNVGIIPSAEVLASDMGKDGNSNVTYVPAAEKEKLGTAGIQDNYLWSGSNGYLVLLDPWGNPYHYREWSSIRSTIKDAYMESPNVQRSGFAAQPGTSGQAVLSGAITDNIHSAESYDIWSNGPNGCNEFGAPDSDDVTSWRE